MRLKTNKSGESKERRQNYFVDLPPTPLAENHFGKKTLAEENRQNFPKWNWWKRTKISIFFFVKNSCFLADFFLNGIGGYSPPLTESHCAQKSLAERGGTPSPPLTGKIR